MAPSLRDFQPFKKARAFIRRLGLRTRQEWQSYCKGRLPGKGRKPKDIPILPNVSYKDEGWIGWGDWLGTGAVASFLRQYRSFVEAVEFVRQLGLGNQTEWTTYCKGKLPGRKPKPDDIPANPYQTYVDKGWTSLGDWLGTGNVAPFLRQFRKFKIAHRFIRQLGLRNQAEWRSYCKGEMPDKGKKPDDIPGDPYGHYKDDGWVNWGDWFGTGSVAPSLREFQPFKKGSCDYPATRLAKSGRVERLLQGRVAWQGKETRRYSGCSACFVQE